MDAGICCLSDLQQKPSAKKDKGKLRERKNVCGFDVSICRNSFDGEVRLIW